MIPLPREEGPKAHYWHLKNKDPGMQKFGQERAELIVKEFTKIVREYCKRSYENVFSTDETLYRKSDQRIDFMINVQEKVLEFVSLELGKLNTERNRRL